MILSSIARSNITAITALQTDIACYYLNLLLEIMLGGSFTFTGILISLDYNTLIMWIQTLIVEEYHSIIDTWWTKDSVSCLENL